VKSVIYQVQKCEQENPVLRSGRGSKKKIKKKEKGKEETGSKGKC